MLTMSLFNIECVPFGTIAAGAASLIKMSSQHMDVTITNYGITVVSIEVPDRSDVKKNVVAGFSSLESYLGNHPYIGYTIGRFANRIADGRFCLGDKEYQLSLNDGLNHLHGGSGGFHRKLWAVKSIISESDVVGVVLSCFNKDGEEGCPGNLDITLKYTLDSNGLHISFEAYTDKPAVVILTNHPYFNLSGFEEDTIYNRSLKILADSYLVKNKNNIPSGEIAPVADTVYDFIRLQKLGQYIAALSEDKGYDHDWVWPGQNFGLVLIAELSDSVSGGILKIFTDCPGVHVYTANWWDRTWVGQQGRPYCQHGAVALETQSFPDTPNHAHFPNTILYPGKKYSAQTVFQFQTIS